MNKLRLISYLLVLAYSFMQAGASLFAIMVNVSTLIKEPPASLYMVQGQYGFNPDIFWDNFPNMGMVLFIIALIINWKSPLRKWILIGFSVGLFAALSAIFLLEPIQSEFLNAPYSETISPDLKLQGNLWFNYSLLFFMLSFMSGVVYAFGLISLFQKKSINH